MKKYLAEALGTFALVFVGTGAIMVNDVTNGSITHVGIALSFGLVIMTMIYAYGEVSGAQFNPAVTVGFTIARGFPRSEALRYILSQVVGALLASALLLGMFPDHATLGSTLPSGSALQSLIFEIVMTFFLMIVILGVTSGTKEKGIVAGIAIGAAIALDALFGGPISGASMNPARSFAPALLSGNFGTFWIYLIGPVLGAALAALASRYLHSRNPA